MEPSSRRSKLSHVSLGICFALILISMVVRESRWFSLFFQCKIDVAGARDGRGILCADYDDQLASDLSSSNVSSFHDECESVEKRNSTNPFRPRIAFVTYTHLASLERWHKSIFPSLQYVVPESEKYYVILGSNWTDKYAHLIKNDATFRNHSHRIQPIFVDCPVEAKNGESLCCKQEKGLLQFHDRFYYACAGKEHSAGGKSDGETQRQHLGTPKYDWVLFQDDDNFVRRKELEIFLSPISSLEEPVILASDAPPGHFLGQFGYMPAKSPYKCSRDLEFAYPWGQPLLYNQVSFDQVVPAFRLGGLLSQCREYNVTIDVGNALLHWMFSFKAVWFRNPNGVKDARAFRGDMLGMHLVGRGGERSEMPNIVKAYAEPYGKYPFNDTFPATPSMVWTNTTGFRRTNTFAKFGLPSTWDKEWHTMPVADCRV